MFQIAIPQNEEHLYQLINAYQHIMISSLMRIRILWSRNCVWSWKSVSVHWKQWLQYCNIMKYAPGGFHKCSHRKKKNTVYKSVRSTTVKMEWQCVNPLLNKNFKMQPSAGKVFCTFLWDRKWMIFLNFLKPWQTIISDDYITMLTKLKGQTSRVREQDKAKEEDNPSLAT